MHRRLLCALLLFAAVAIAVPAPASAVGLPPGWTKGFNYTAWWHDGYSTAAAQASLDALATTGANEIALFPTWYMASSTSSAVAADPARTPTDASLAVAVARAKAKGLKVMLRPSVDPLDGSSRLYLAPASPSAWFSSYRTMILHYAELAARLDVDSLSIGLELQSLTVPGYESAWRSIIADVRARFSGSLTYGAAVLEYERIPWWDALDVIGVDAYFQLSNGATPSEDQVVANWHLFTDQYGRTHRYVDEIAAVQARFRKPVIFTELGYRSALNVLVDPWSAGGTYSAVDQQTAIAAAFRVFRDKPWFHGVHLWHWFAQNPLAGGIGDTDLTPQNKPAQATITRWFTAPALDPAPVSAELPAASEPATASAPQPAPAPLPAPAAQPGPNVEATTTSAPPTAPIDDELDGRRSTSTTLRASAGARAARGRTVKLSGRVRGARTGSVRITLAPVRRSGGRRRPARTVVARLRGGRYATSVRVGESVRAVAAFPGSRYLASSRSAARLVRG